MHKNTTLIPKGYYCYTLLETPSKENNFKFKTKYCPYLSLNPDKPDQMNGYCSYLERGDWSAEIPENFPEDFPLSCLSLLWDACKQCNVNLDEEIVD
jgi:hypothetical protein